LLSLSAYYNVTWKYQIKIFNLNFENLQIHLITYPYINSSLLLSLSAYPLKFEFLTIEMGFKKNVKLFVLSIFILFIVPTLIAAECTCDEEDEERDRSKALRYKIAALVSILVASAIGVCIPLLGKVIPALSPEKDIFFIVKAFAAGVILSTGFIHVLPDAFENLTSPCLNEHPWGEFPFTGFVAMCTAMGTLMVDTYATAYFQNHYSKRTPAQVESHTTPDVENEEQTHVHAHASHSHAHGHISLDQSSELLRHRVISQVIII